MMARPQELSELIDDIDRERVERAMSMSDEEKFSAGFKLFLRSRALMEAGIRGEFPGISEREIDEVIEQRLDLIRDKGEYRP